MKTVHFSNFILIVYFKTSRVYFFLLFHDPTTLHFLFFPLSIPTPYSASIATLSALFPAIGEKFFYFFVFVSREKLDSFTNFILLSTEVESVIEFPHTHGSTVDEEVTFGLGCSSLGSIGIRSALEI